MKGSPAFQWYPKDYLSSGRVAVMSLAEEGAYRRALDYCWIDGYIPSDPTALARLIGKECSIDTATKVQGMFAKHRSEQTKLIHVRLQKERKKQHDFARKCSKAGVTSGKIRRLRTNERSTNVQRFVEPESNSAICNLQSSTPVVPPTPKDRARRLHGIPSSVEEVISKGQSLNPKKDEKTCRDFWAHYEGQARTSPNGEVFWVTSGEAVVTNWAIKLSVFGKDGQGTPAKRTDMGQGTRNEGKSSQYEGVGRLKQ